MTKGPCVNFGLLGEEYRITDYIQVDNPHLQRVADQLTGTTVNHLVAKVARFVAKNVQYALNRKGKASACRMTRVFKYHGPIFLVDTGELPYGWLFPNQTLQAGYGICFDTSVLTCTLLRLKALNAKVVLGAVFSADKQKLRGFHAWVEVQDKANRLLVVETTSPKEPTIWLAEDVYSGRFGFIYDPVCWFHDDYWMEDKDKSKEYTELVVNVLQKEKATRTR